MNELNNYDALNSGPLFLYESASLCLLKKRFQIAVERASKGFWGLFSDSHRLFMDILKTPAGRRPQVSGGPIIDSADGRELNSFCAELNHI